MPESYLRKDSRMLAGTFEVRTVSDIFGNLGEKEMFPEPVANQYCGVSTRPTDPSSVVCEVALPCHTWNSFTSTLRRQPALLRITTSIFAST